MAEQKTDKKPLSLEARLVEKSIQTMEGEVGKRTKERLQSGESNTQILKDLLGTVSNDPKSILRELSEAEVPIPGSRKGILALGDLIKGQFPNILAPRTEPRGQEEALKILKDAIAIQERRIGTSEKRVKEEKAKETLGQASIEGGVAEREAKIKGRGEGIKALEKGKIEDLAKAQKTAPKSFRFIQQYARSVEELRKFDPDIEKGGIEGKARRIRGVIATNLDKLPETQALQILIQPLANAMAREVEGGRVTDQDRSIYANAFANALQNPGATNTRLVSSSVVDLIDKGADMVPQLKQMAAEDLDVFNDVINQVIIEHPDLVDDIFGEGAEVVE